MLLPTEVDPISKERSCKQDLVWPGGSAGSKIIFKLMAEVIALYMGSTTVNVRGFGLELVPRSRSTLSRDLEECLDDSIQVPLVIMISVKIMGKWSLRGSRKSLKRSRKSLGGFRFV